MYGEFGGQYAPETLMIALEELEAAYEQLKEDPDMQTAHLCCIMQRK